MAWIDAGHVAEHLSKAYDIRPVHILLDARIGTSADGTSFKGRNHIGTWPTHLRETARHDDTKAVIASLAKALETLLQARPPLRIGIFCKSGAHRSVGHLRPSARSTWPRSWIGTSGGARAWIASAQSATAGGLKILRPM